MKKSAIVIALCFLFASVGMLCVDKQAQEQTSVRAVTPTDAPKIKNIVNNPNFGLDTTGLKKASWLSLVGRLSGTGDITGVSTTSPLSGGAASGSLTLGVAGLSGYGTAGQLVKVNATTNGWEYFTPAYLTAETGDVASVTSTTPLTGGGTTGALTVGLAGLTTFGTPGQLIKTNESATGWEYFTPLYLTSETGDISAVSPTAPLTGGGESGSLSLGLGGLTTYGTAGQLVKTNGSATGWEYFTPDYGDITSVTVTSPLTGGGESGTASIGIGNLVSLGTAFQTLRMDSAATSMTWVNSLGNHVYYLPPGTHTIPAALTAIAGESATNRATLILGSGRHILTNSIAIPDYVTIVGLDRESTEIYIGQEVLVRTFYMGTYSGIENLTITCAGNYWGDGRAVFCGAAHDRYNVMWRNLNINVDGSHDNGVVWDFSAYRVRDSEITNCRVKNTDGTKYMKGVYIGASTSTNIKIKDNIFENFKWAIYSLGSNTSLDTQYKIYNNCFKNNYVGVYFGASAEGSYYLSLNNNIYQETTGQDVWIDGYDNASCYLYSYVFGESPKIYWDGQGIWRPIDSGSDAQLLDDGIFHLPSGRCGWATIYCGDQWAYFVFTSAAVPTVLMGSAKISTTAAAGDDSLMVYDGGAYVAVKNRLGGTKKFICDIHSFVP